MASASSLHISVTFKCSSASHNERLFVGHHRIPSLVLRPDPSSRSVLACSRRRSNRNSAITSSSSSSSKKKNKQSLPRNDVGEDDDLDEDAFEALFRQLEEDLKNDDPSANDGDDEISEEDLAMLERELEEALGDDELLRVFGSAVDETSKEIEEDDDDNEEKEDDDDDDDDNEEPVKLKNWQLKRLGYALKNGRRKTSIKNLAAELCLDRAVVLELLRDPPPNLLMMSAALPDKPVPTISEPETEETSVSIPLGTEKIAAKLDAKVKVPVHEMQSSWSAQKRLKKVQVETLERVYRRTKRPTNAMVSNIVHVTNLPRKRVVKWFEDKRADDGVPDQRLPYQRPVPSGTHAAPSDLTRSYYLARRSLPCFELKTTWFNVRLELTTK